ncbi:SufD family Fe-S cluster assembly protein [Lachnospiraceae bacterium 54-53]
MNMKINSLPVPTWNHTGVNQAESGAALPQAALPGGRPASYDGALPAGVRLLKDLPAGVSGIPSGMGDEVDRFVKEGADKVCFLQAEKDAEEPVTLTHVLDPARPLMRIHCGIVAKAGSRLTVVSVNRGDAENGALATLTQIHAEEGSLVRLVQVQLLGGNSRSWDAVGARIGKGARVELVRAVMGGSVAACGSLACLESRGASYDLTAAYYGDGERYLDFNDVAEHTGRETLCEMYTAGVLADKSSKILRGTIDFRSGAVRSVGHENETVLLLSPAARNRTAPLILCGEEQVEGQHAATLGRFDEKQLYYLCSRGLTPTQAKRLMVEARFSPVLDKLPDEALRREILENIERRLDSHENNPG